MSEKISALLDGEFEEDQALEAIRAVLSSHSADKSTRDYQLIGDAMRGEQGLNVDLTQSIMDKIELEPTILSPNAIQPSEYKTRGQHSPNDNVTSLSQRLPQSWSIAASVAAVVAVGLLMLDQNENGSISDINPNMAVAMQNISQSDQSALSTQAEAQTPSIPLEYLKAHRVSVPSVASHYIQTANFSE